MRATLIFNSNLRSGRPGGDGGDAPGKSVGLLRTDTGLGAEQRWL